MQEELVRLLKDLENHPSARKRSALARDLSDLCLSDEESLSGAEATLFFDILSALIKDVEFDVRKRLAERLAVREDVPRDLIAFLADDEIEVAYPVLVSSELLDDEDLVRIVSAKAREHRLAVAKRHWLGPDVSDALIQTGDSTVVVALLRNDSAEIYPETVEALVRSCRDIPEYREPLAHRDDLSPEIAAKLYVWVGDVLRDHIVERFELEASVIEDAISAVLSEAMNELASVAGEERVDRDLPDKVQASRASKLLLNFLQSGVAPRFEQHFGQLTALSPSAVKRALYHAGEKGWRSPVRARVSNRMYLRNSLAPSRQRRVLAVSRKSEVHQSNGLLRVGRSCRGTASAAGLANCAAGGRVTSIMVLGSRDRRPAQHLPQAFPKIE